VEAGNWSRTLSMYNTLCSEGSTQVPISAHEIALQACARRARDPEMTHAAVASAVSVVRRIKTSGLQPSLGCYSSLLSLLQSAPGGSRAELLGELDAKQEAAALLNQLMTAAELRLLQLKVPAMVPVGALLGSGLVLLLVAQGQSGAGQGLEYDFFTSGSFQEEASASHLSSPLAASSAKDIFGGEFPDLFGSAGKGSSSFSTPRDLFP